MTCAPNNADFIHVVSFANETKGLAIKEIDYILTNEFANGMFNSCSNVQMPSANEKALSLLCGRDADECTPANWLEYMGSTSNGQAPFQINMFIHDGPWHPTGDLNNSKSFTPMNASITPCDQKYGNESACSCQDCLSSCSPVPPIPSPSKPFTIAGYDGYYVVMFCFFVVFSIVFMITVKWTNKNYMKTRDTEKSENDQVGENTTSYHINGAKVQGAKRKQANKSEYSSIVSESDISSLEKLGERFERVLQVGFESWGRWCATHPVMVLVVGLAIAGGLCGGIVMFQVVTDPVKLWSAPNSVARTQKDYFDKHFG